MQVFGGKEIAIRLASLCLVGLAACHPAPPVAVDVPLRAGVAVARHQAICLDFPDPALVNGNKLIVLVPGGASAAAEVTGPAGDACKPLESKRLWHFCYPLGYDVEPDCSPRETKTELEASMPLSGPAWVARFPTSVNVNDLAPAFRGNATRLLAALRQAGASVEINATLRPAQHAYLVHYSWRIASERFDPATARAMAGKDIR